VVINRLETAQERRDYAAWLEVRDVALRDPARRNGCWSGSAATCKMPVFIQGGIHGNEYEGVDAAVDTIEKYATTAVRQDRQVDAILSHLILVFNPTQKPGRRASAARARTATGSTSTATSYTQSQSETIASISLMKRWLAPRCSTCTATRQPDADRGDDQAAQPEHRVRQLA
jgi:hypothetical protein